MLSDYIQHHYPGALESGLVVLRDRGAGPFIQFWDESLGQRPAVEDVQAWEPPPPTPAPRTQALRPEEIAAAREAIAQAEDLARQSTQTKYRDALLLLTATFDGVLAKLGGEQ